MLFPLYTDCIRECNRVYTRLSWDINILFCKFKDDRYSKLERGEGREIFPLDREAVFYL